MREKLMPPFPMTAAIPTPCFLCGSLTYIGLQNLTHHEHNIIPVGKMEKHTEKDEGGDQVLAFSGGILSSMSCLKSCEETEV